MIKTYPTKLPRIQRRIRWLFIFSIVALVCFAGVIYQQRKSETEARLLVSHTYSVIKKIDSIDILLSQSESAARGYLVTKDPSLKQQLKLLHLQLNSAISEIQKLTEDNATQQATIEKIKPLILQKLAIQTDVIAGTLSQNNLLPLLESITRLNQSVVLQLKSLTQAEEKLLQTRTAQNESNAKNSAYTALIGGVFSFLLVLAILIQLNRDIYLRKKAEVNLTKSEAQYRNLIENSEVVMFTTDINGIITFVNNQAVALTGYTAEELVSKDFYFLLHPAWMQQVLNFYTNQFGQKIPSTTLEFLIRTKSGQQKWVDQSAQLMFDSNNQVQGFQCMVKDISAKKAVEIELKESEAKRKENQYRLESVINNSTSTIFIKDLQGRYVMVNKRFKEIMKLTSDEQVIDKTDYDLSTKTLADHYSVLDQQVINSLQPIESEELVERPEGNINLLLVKFPLMDRDNNIFGIGGIASDITDRTAYQKHLISAKKSAEEAKLMQEQFLANMSHEIRTPMNGIQGMTNLLLGTALDEQQKEFTNSIKRSVNNLLVLLNDILDFSKIKAGRLTIEKKPFNINTVIEEVKSLLTHRMEKKGLTLQVQIDSRIPATLVGDPGRLSQVLVNLIGNAVKFTERGSVKVQISLQQKARKSVIIQCVIADTGIGIPADKIDTIFESFAQADSGITRRYGGAGLGLAISKSLVQLQGGDISVKSKPGEGSVFSFFLPYGLKQKSDGSQPGLEDQSVLGKHFLVVEDNEVNQKLIGYVLRKEGALVDIAGNGKEAIRYFENKRKYDLVITDIQMPEMDGYETATYIRQVMKSDMPIIAMTATALKGDKERCMEVGMNDFMLKPFDFEDLFNRILRLMYRDAGDTAALAENETGEIKLYDLSLLEELDDKASLLDVLNIFLSDAPTQVKELPVLATRENWEALYKLAHKLKGAVGLLQAKQVAALLGSIEENAKEAKNTQLIREEVDEVVHLFAQLEAQLHEAQERIEKEIASAEGKELFL
ncbi:MAG: PAS domain S-box protein [Sediminibacterium sp.]